MRSTRLIAAVAAATALSGPVMAQGYVGLSAGQVKVNIDCSGTLTCDRSDTAYKVFGGYMFTPNLGVEAGYYNQGKVSQTATDDLLGDVSATWKGNGLGLFGVASMPFDRASVFAKLGVVSTKVKLDAVSSVAGAASGSDRNTNFGWGLGAGYEFTKNIGGRVEFERVRIEFEGEKRNADLLTIGLVYRF